MSKKLVLALSLIMALATGHSVFAQKTIGNAGSNLLHSAHQPDQVPSHRTCLAEEAYADALDRHPGLRTWEQEDHQNYLRFMDNRDNQKTTGTITIPVVFHVIYSINANAVPASRLQSQIDVLNEDFSRTNSDAGNTPAAFQGIAANTNIQFCLATQDPNGNAHSGITRTQSSNANTSYPNGEAALKAVIQWDPNSYLNIWVVENISGGVLGYATFPSSLPFDPQLDGVVLDEAYTGRNSSGAPFNQGRTGTHEVGHWLGLLHTFSGGCAGLTQSTCNSQGDRICDTPPTSSSNFNCPGTQNTCNETFPSNQNDMTMNYMDYVNDACMNLFTQDQADRMNFYLNSTRASLQNSPGCQGGGGGQPTQCAGTDTVNFPVTGTLVNYTTTAGGYISGHNGYGDLAKAEYYSNSQNYTSVNGMRFLFGTATAANSNSSVTARIWDEANGEPGQILHTETLNINNIATVGGDVTVMFASPVTVNGAFFVGVELDYSTPGDTVSLITNSQGDVTTNTAWEQFSNGDWFPYDDGSSWGIELSNSAHPVIEGMTVSIAPASPTIPSGGSIQLTSTSSVSNTTYSWSPSAGLSCNNCANPVASPTNTTVYTLTATDVAANCTTVTSVTVSVGTVSIQNDLFEEEVAAYPNPSNGSFMLEFSTADINDLDISIYNNLGQALYNEKLDDFTGDYRKGINLEMVPAGVYHLRITNGAKAYYEKLVIE